MPPGVSAFNDSRYETLHTPRMKKAILRHCSSTPALRHLHCSPTMEIFQLDETGNNQVLAQTTTTSRKVRATVTGAVDRTTLNVQSLSNSTAATAASH